MGLKSKEEGGGVVRQSNSDYILIKTDLEEVMMD